MRCSFFKPLVFLSAFFFLPLPARAAVDPYLAATLGGAVDSSFPADVGLSQFPLERLDGVDGMGARVLASVDGGLDLGLGPYFGLYGGLGARDAQSILSATNGFSGEAYLVGHDPNLPLGLSGSIGYAYRDSFQGLQAQDVMGALQRVSPAGPSAYVDLGYEGFSATQAGVAYQGPFAGGGLRIPDPNLGLTYLVDLDVAGQGYGGGRQDILTTPTIGVRKPFPAGFTVWGRGGPTFAHSSTPGQSYIAPSVAFGVTWSLN